VQHQAIHTDKWHMINCVCNILGLSHGTCWHILPKDLNMKQIAAKSMAHVLNDDQAFSVQSTCKIKPKKDSNSFLTSPFSQRWKSS
jgi:hypothetical protein